MGQTNFWELILKEYNLVKGDACRMNQPDLNQFESFENFLINLVYKNLDLSSNDIECAKSVIANTYSSNNRLVEYAILDYNAYIDKDPSIKFLFDPILFSSGFIITQLYRLSNILFEKEYFLSKHIHTKLFKLFAVDIHPCASIGYSFFLDHAIGLVIGETAVIGNNVSILHGVTLGGTGKDAGDRHPKIQDNVMIGAGAKILGNIIIKKNTKIGAGSVVVESTDSFSTYVGVPARKINKLSKGYNPANQMGQTFN